MTNTRADYVIITPFDIVKAATLPRATMAQYVESHTLTWACTFVKGKTASIYADRDMLSEYLMILECSGSNVPSLFPVEIKLKTAPMFKNY